MSEKFRQEQFDVDETQNDNEPVVDKIINEPSKKIIDALLSGNVNRAIKLKEKSERVGDVLDDLEIRNATAEAIKDKIKRWSIDFMLAVRLRKKFDLPDENFYAAVESVLAESPYILKNRIKEIKEQFGLPEEYIKRAAEKALFVAIKDNNELAEYLIKEFNISEEMVYFAAEEKIIRNLSEGNLRWALETKKKFKLPEDTMEKPVMVEAAQGGVLKCLELGKFYEADEFKKHFDIPKGFYKEKATVEAVKAGIKVEISSSKGDIETVNKKMITFEINYQKFTSSKEFMQSAGNGVWSKLSDGQIEDAMDIFRFCPDVEKNAAGIDEHVAEGLSVDKYDLTSILLKFIPFLGRQDIRKLFPETFDKIVLLLNETLENNQDLADYFLENLDKYYKHPWVKEALLKAVIHYSVAAKFCSAEHLHTLPFDFNAWKKNTEKPWKDESWAESIFSQAKEVITEHQQDGDSQDDDYGPGRENEGFSESDPHGNHLWIVDSNKIKLASVVDRLLDCNYDNNELEKLEINIAELAPFLDEIRAKITEAYYNFLDNAGRSGKISDEDIKSFTDSEHPFYPENSLKLKMLTSNVRGFISRYLAGLADGDKNKLIEIAHDPKKFILEFKRKNIEIVEDEIKSLSIHYAQNEDKIEKRGEQIKHINDMHDDVSAVINEGFNRYINVLEVDVPLYDKLYEEFDNLRETGRNPLEVYLGRDGIYAYVGRRAQDLARRRKMGLKGRKKQKEMGEVIEINPKYLVYPRYFRDFINRKVKGEFLKQEQISPDLDPVFYDTGYTGTIPEQIIRITLTEAGWDQKDIEEEIEKRIRLLSAPSVHRRVKGIPENARQEIIEYIEHNAKTEETAEGLYKDKETGKIKPIAKPTNPEEQFYYAMVKQAISRHYWLKEKLHHEPSGNMNLDSEHYTIRIREEYKDLLPKEFIKNPRSFFSEHGELLKGNKGEGEYPDEEIVLFKLEDGTEIVAKKIEIRKAKEARKEFSILIAAKKIGLPTAEPVGFLSGKEEKDGSYLLMKKIEGYSGRNFDKYLQGQGKFTVEKIKKIMKVIADKNKEMAELFRQTLKIDKHWRIKDTIIEFNEETGEVGDVIPIDWERAKDYDESNPQKIDEIQ